MNLLYRMKLAFRTYLQAELNKYNKNIEAELQRQGRLSTVTYVGEHMWNVPSFKDKYALLDYALSLPKPHGYVMEFGVYKGDTINKIAKKLPDQKIYGFDSWQGIPDQWRDHLQYAYKAPKMPKVAKNVELVPGWFKNSIPKFLGASSTYGTSFIHIDCDLYSSTLDVLLALKDVLQEGTIIQFDEYFNFYGWKKHEHKALQEFMDSHETLSYEYIGYCRYHEQVLIRIIKK